MALAAPHGLSPSKVESFTSCALAFRFSTIDRLPDPPSPAAVKGTLVHRALELLHAAPPAERTPATAAAALATARRELHDDPEFIGLGLDEAQEEAFAAEAAELVANYFRLEDPSSVRAVGLELRLEARVGGTVLRGVIDRLDLDDAGELVVTDYKTGRAPNERHERGRLNGVHVYALLCERLLGRRPARIQLYYLSQPLAIAAVPTDQSIRFVERKLAALWSAVERACEREDFRPNPGPLCNHCAFQAYCPAQGGDPSLALLARPRGAQLPLAAVAM